MCFRRGGGLGFGVGQLGHRRIGGCNGFGGFLDLLHGAAAAGLEGPFFAHLNGNDFGAPMGEVLPDLTALNRLF